MPGLRLVASRDLGALADHWVAHRPPGDPLVRETVVVPNKVVGDWFEQAVATRTGANGGRDGVAANLDLLFVAGLLGRALYGDAAALDEWGAAALAVEIHAADARCSMGEALRRGAALADLVALRGDELDAHLGADRAAERAVVNRRAAHGQLAPTEQFAAGALVPSAGRLTLVGALASPYGPLAPRVVRALSAGADVTLYAALGARELFEAPRGAPEDRSLVERWGAPLAAHLALWREHAGFDDEQWLDGGGAGARADVLAALGGRSSGEGEPSATPFLEVHSTVGLARQVEVARDALLGALEASGRAPHEARVAAVDPGAAAPLLAAYFTPSAVEADDAPRLQVEVADPAVPRRSLRLDAFVSVLRAVGGTSTLHDVASLLTAPSLRQGLGLGADEVERVVRLGAQGRVGVGLDADDDARAGVFEPGSDAGTWRRLLDRVALATCFDPGGGGEVAPLGSAEDLAAAASAAPLIGALAAVARRARGARPLDEWVGDLRALAALIERDESVRDPSLDRLVATLDRLAPSSARDVTLEEVRDLVDALCAGGGGASLLGRGGASMVGLAAGAAIPFALSAVVGLDDETMPDARRRVGELGESRPTDPDPRAELRAGLLLTLASTSERVLLFTSDRRAVDGVDLDPALVLDELDEALAAGDPALRATRRRHPRHGFSTSPDANGDVAEPGGVAFSLDPAHAVAASRLARAPALDDDLPLFEVAGAPPDPGPVDVEQLVRFLRRPQRVFLHDAFASARLPEAAAERADAPPVAAGTPLDLYPWREGELAAAVETGDDPVAPAGPDSVVGTVAAGWRARALEELDVAGLASFARALRDGFAVAGATRSPGFAAPAVVAGASRDVERGPLGVYDTARGPVLVEFTPARRYGARLVGLIARAAVATLEARRAVPGVLLRAQTPDEARRHPSRRPVLVVRWRPGDAAADAAGLLDGLIALYDARLERLPLHAMATALATDERFGPRGEAVVDAPDQEWLTRGFRGRDDRGESLSPECRLLLPLTYRELREARGGEFVAQSRALTRALAAVEVEATGTDGPWLDLAEAGGG